MESYVTLFLPRIESLGVIFYWAIFIVGIAESLPFVSIIIPSGLILIAAGFIASEGAYHPADLIWAAAAGSVIGDSIGYYLGRKGGRSFFEKSRFYRPVFLEKTDEFFDKHGGTSIYIGRFVGALRPFVAFVAGMHKMPYGKFLFFNIPSAVLWVAVYVLVGYFFSAQSKVIGMWIGRTGYIALAVVLFAAALVYFYARKRKLLKVTEL